MAGGHRNGDGADDNRSSEAAARPQLTEPELRQLLRWGLIGIAVVQLVYGGGYMLGARATAPSLQLMGGFMPMPVWGALLVVAGAALIVRWYLLAFTVAGFVFAVWAGFSLTTVLTGTATGWGWPPIAGYAVVNLAAAWIRGRLNARTPTP